MRRTKRLTKWTFNNSGIFWDSCAQNKTSEISNNGFSGILGLLCAEEDVGNLRKCTFKNSGTPARRTHRRTSKKMTFQEYWDSSPQNKTSEISKNALSGILALQDHGSWVQDPGSRILDPGSRETCYTPSVFHDFHLKPSSPDFPTGKFCEPGLARARPGPELAVSENAAVRTPPRGGSSRNFPTGKFREAADFELKKQWPNCCWASLTRTRPKKVGPLPFSAQNRLPHGTSLWGSSVRTPPPRGGGPHGSIFPDCQLRPRPSSGQARLTKLPRGKSGEDGFK